MARRAANPAPARPVAAPKPEPLVVPEPETVEPKKARIKQAVADALTTSDLNPREAERLLSDHTTGWTIQGWRPNSVASPRRRSSRRTASRSA